MGWDVLSRGYIADPSDSTKKVLSAVTLRDPLDSINQVIINYTWNSNGTINKETLVALFDNTTISFSASADLFFERKSSVADSPNSDMFRLFMCTQSLIFYRLVVLQSVSTTFSDPQSMDMEGHTLYQIAALETTIKPKKAGSTLVINWLH
jgi:hypothetical protein